MKEQFASSPAMEIKFNQYGQLINQWFGGQKKKKNRPPIPAPTHCLEYTSQNCLRKTKKAEQRRHWQVKNRLLIVPALFSQDNVWGSAQCGDADTPGVAWTNLVETQEPRYTDMSSCCSTPTHRLPQCTRLIQNSTKIKQSRDISHRRIGFL